jgi:putative transposase
VIDWCRKFAKYIVLKAKRTKSIIVLEDLEKLWLNASKKSSSLADKLSRLAYRKLQLAIITKAIEHNVPVIFVNPRNTSSVCPRCGVKLTYNHRLAICRKCGFIADRDTVGAMNIYFKALKILAPCPGSRGTRSMTNETRLKSGLSKNEPMTVHIQTCIKYEEANPLELF